MRGEGVVYEVTRVRSGDEKASENIEAAGLVALDGGLVRQAVAETLPAARQKTQTPYPLCRMRRES
jgi:hypothetical protein